MFSVTVKDLTRDLSYYNVLSVDSDTFSINAYLMFAYLNGTRMYNVLSINLNAQL